MNKRIKLLAEQAGFGLRRDGEIYTSRLEHLPITEDLAKFAESIVMECIDVGIKDFYNHLPNIFPANAIKQHFGVEE